MSFNLIILDHINNLIIASSLLIVFYLLLIMLPNKFTIYRKYSSLQKIHQHDIPRLGGFGIFIFLYFFNYLSGKTIFLDSLIIASLPLFFVMVKEDVFHNTKPINRIIFTFISFILFINLFQLHLPNLTFEVLNIFFDYSYLFKLFFFFLCLVFLLNGNNLVDGTNGLLIATIIVQILCLLFFSFMFLDYELFFNLFLLLVPVFIFFIFNYPKGFIFLGDSGAYFIGLYLGLLTINFFIEHPQQNNLYAFLIFFYPIFEIFFTSLRRLFNRKALLKADLGHIHSKLYLHLKNILIFKFPNSLVMPALFFIWANPLFFLVLSYYKVIPLLLCFFFQVTIYLIYYIFINKISK